METPTCPKCSQPLRWREPTDTLREQMFVSCDCTDIDFERAELAASSAGPEAGVYSHPTMVETRTDGRDLRADIVEYWGAAGLTWIEQKAGIR